MPIFETDASAMSTVHGVNHSLDVVELERMGIVEDIYEAGEGLMDQLADNVISATKTEIESGKSPTVFIPLIGGVVPILNTIDRAVRNGDEAFLYHLLEVQDGWLVNLGFCANSQDGSKTYSFDRDLDYIDSAIGVEDIADTLRTSVAMRGQLPPEASFQLQAAVDKEGTEDELSHIQAEYGLEINYQVVDTLKSVNGEHVWARSGAGMNAGGANAPIEVAVWQRLSKKFGAAMRGAREMGANQIQENIQFESLSSELNAGVPEIEWIGDLPEFTEAEYWPSVEGLHENSLFNLLYNLEEIKRSGDEVPSRQFAEVHRFFVELSHNLGIVA